MGAQNYSYFNKEKVMGVFLFICQSALGDTLTSISHP